MANIIRGMSNIKSIMAAARVRSDSISKIHFYKIAEGNLAKLDAR